MLWFDDDSSSSVADKIIRASRYYAEKYGRIPNLCFLHSEEANEKSVDGIAVKASNAVLPDHFWLGIKE
jgi:hypothetical protein